MLGWWCEGAYNSIMARTYCCWNFIRQTYKPHGPTTIPLVAKLAGGDVPQDRIVDGRDLLPLLTRKSKVSSHDFIFHYCGNQIHAVRFHPRNSDIVWKLSTPNVTPQWTNGTEYCIDKGVCDCHGDRVTVHKQPLLFDITNDPAENAPIAADIPKYQEVMKHIYPAIKVHKESRLKLSLIS